MIPMTWTADYSLIFLLSNKYSPLSTAMATSAAELCTPYL